MFYQFSSYFKKHLLVDVQQKFFPKTFVKFNALNLQTSKQIHLRKIVRFTYRRPNLK